MINLPVLERVRVSNYALYVGTPDSPGLDHTFRPGVNVIVGINGLGKTTLLNILLRSLTGASDIPGDDQLGDKKRRLVPSDRLWFRRRVNRPGNRGGCLVKVQRSSAQRQSGYGDRVLPPVQEEYSRWTR
ncbi:AAA family ATPase, partial [Burkholderia multivorans]|uniref:AAA family ATPase n=1 Tax=Burkholderia multivorans TaxID=87883 RepID=UPI001C23663A